MRLLLLLLAGVTLVKSIPKITKAAANATGHITAGLDDMYSGVARKIGQTTESIEDRLAERRYNSETNRQLPPQA